MTLGSFFKKQFIDVIQWTENGDGVLSYRYPMQDMEIQYGAKLTVRESQMALFVNEGKAADAFGPGLFTLETRTLPLLTNLMNWDKLFQSPFKSDVYFFSTRVQTDQKWGTQQPITIRDKDFGIVRLRGFGIYSWHVKNPLVFHKKISGTRDTYTVADLEEHLRNSIVGKVSDTFANSRIPFLDMASNLNTLSATITEQLGALFSDIGLALDTFVVENLSLPDELQSKLDQRIGINMAGNLQELAQYQAAQAMTIAAGNPGGAAGAGVGIGAGMAMGKAMADAMNRPAAPASGASQGGAPSAQPAGTKFCIACGKPIPRASKFCPECGGTQE